MRPQPKKSPSRRPTNRNVEEIEYEDWYPEVPPVMDTKDLAELLHTNEQIIRAWVREGILPAHRKPGGRKFTFLRHEIFDWLISNRYSPD
jgi:hypothetical protein